MLCCRCILMILTSQPLVRFVLATPTLSAVCPRVCAVPCMKLEVQHSCITTMVGSRSQGHNYAPLHAVFYPFKVESVTVRGSGGSVFQAMPTNKIYRRRRRRNSKIIGAAVFFYRTTTAVQWCCYNTDNTSSGQLCNMYKNLI